MLTLIKDKKMDQQLFPIRQTAKILGVSYSWLNRKVTNKRIKIVKLGGQRMITKEEIERIKKEGVK